MKPAKRVDASLIFLAAANGYVMPSQRDYIPLPNVRDGNTHECSDRSFYTSGSLEYIKTILIIATLVLQRRKAAYVSATVPC